ncbi:hypothetical protein F4677DRAFT_410524 [Hypoxylon crocopeplum]|nr:hypothetical protein F4677DRAFT_410524 [Hypoxylon crocopeplum]
MSWLYPTVSGPGDAVRNKAFQLRMADPAPPTAELSQDSDWETTLIVHSNWMEVTPERRHSGWGAVERGWTGDTQPPQPTGSKPSSQRTKEAREAMAHFPYPQMSIPTPGIEFDFRIRVALNPQSASVSVADGFKKYTTIAEGMWSGRFGHGLVLNGGQDSQDVTHGEAMATQVESTLRLQTRDEPPAYIECKSRGNRTGPPELMKALQDPETAGQVDHRLCPFRIFMTLKTSDERYAGELNTGMWVGSCLWKGLEVLYDAYRIT